MNTFLGHMSYNFLGNTSYTFVRKHILILFLGNMTYTFLGNTSYTFLGNTSYTFLGDMSLHKVSAGASAAVLDTNSNMKEGMYFKLSKLLIQNIIQT